MMNRQRLYLAVAAWLMLASLMACTPTTNEPESGSPANDVVATAVPTMPATKEPTMNENAETPAEPTPQEPYPPSQAEPTPPEAYPAAPAGEAAANPTIPVPDNPMIQEQIEKAKADLASIVGIDAAQIELVEYQSVTWRDGSLGCPRPGMAYTQMLVEGYRIQLQAKGKQYDYHGAAGRDPFYCANPSR